MNIFHNNIIITEGQVKMTEIPEALNSQRDQPFRNCLRRFLGDTKHRNFRQIFFAEFLNFIAVPNCYIANFGPDQFGIYIERADQLETTFFKIDMIRYCFTQVANSDEDTVVYFIKA